jgi:hypothetical protein
MSTRTIAVLVAVAVVAGLGVAAYGFSTRGSSKPTRVLQIDEVNGRVGEVVLGETRENVLGVLGQPHAVGYAPGNVLLYPHLQIGLRDGNVVSIETDDRSARTEKFVRMGDPISAVRAIYRKAARCIPNAPDKNDPHPRCTVKVPAGRLLVRGDPIKTLTLTTRTRTPVS